MYEYSKQNNEVNPFYKENSLTNLIVGTKIEKEIMPTKEIYFKSDSGFGAYVVEDVYDTTDVMNISGKFVAQLILGQSYRVEGEVKSFRGENQISVTKIKNIKPVNKKGIISYLQTLKGLKSKAELIYDEFGKDSINMLLENPLIVANRVKGIGKKKVFEWQMKLKELQESQQTISTLLSFGLTPKQANKLYEKYGDSIVAQIEENPYFLAKEVKGYGFETCDRIAKEIGISPMLPFRIQEGILHILTQATLSGHCYLPIEDVISKAVAMLSIRLTYEEMRKFARIHSNEETFDFVWGTINDEEADNSCRIFKINYNDLMKSIYNYENSDKKSKEKYRYTVCKISEELIKEALDDLKAQERVVVEYPPVNVLRFPEGCKEDIKVYLRKLYLDEVAVAERVVQLAKKRNSFTQKQVEEVLDDVLKEKGIVLEEKQREACILFNTGVGGFSLLIGSAGTGKTFTLGLIIEIKKRLFKKYLNKVLKVNLYAPTGKASKVASVATKMKCSTIHRGLGFIPGAGFEFNKYNPISADMIVVDESSMLDISLAKDLLEAIECGTQVLFMGDTKQLSSVGAGNVLKDIIESNVADVVVLNVVKRQGLLSGIIKNANKIINGEMIASCEDTKDAFVINRETVEGCQKGIIQSIERILTYDGYNHDEIQVLVPQRKGSVGTYMLNYLLQQRFNPGNEDTKVFYTDFEVIDSNGKSVTKSLFFKKHDKVIHIRNNYDIELYIDNGLGGYTKLLKSDGTPKTGITNGETGRIVDIYTKTNADGSKSENIVVKYDEYYVIYDTFDDLELAWALTIHKSQGSAWKAIVMPVMTQYWNMLDNSLIYTGWTRARDFAVVVGQPKAIRHGISTKKSNNRNTALSEKLIEYSKVA